MSSQKHCLKSFIYNAREHEHQILCAYDQQHSLLYVNHRDTIKLYSKKSGEPHVTWVAKQEQAFLMACDLDTATLQAFKTHNALSEHLMTVVDRYFGVSNPPRPRTIKDLLTLQQQPVSTPYIGQATAEAERIITRRLENAPNSNQLPVLHSITTILKYPWYRAHYQPALTNTLFIIVQQGFLTVIPMIESLLSLGIPKNNIILLTKPRTTTPHTEAQFRQLGVHYMFKRPETDSMSNQSAINEAIDNVVETAQSCLSDNNLKNMIIHDEGGVLCHNNTFIDFVTRTQERPSKLNISVSEHTVSGDATQKSFWQTFHIPHISMAFSWLKADLESYFIAEASFKIATITIDRLLQTPSQESLSIGIIGCGGNIGSAFTKCLIQHYKDHPKIRLNVSEINASEKYTHVLSALHDMRVFHDYGAHTLELLNHSDIVFSATGTDVMPDEILSNLTQSKRTMILCNLATGEREFPSLLKQPSLSKEGQLYRCTLRPIDEIHQISFEIQNLGLPILFNQRDHGVEPFKIDVVRTGAMGAIIQNLTYLSQQHYTNTTTCASDDSARIILDAQLQYAICQAFIQVQTIFKQKQRNDCCISNELLQRVMTISTQKIIELSRGALVRQLNVFEPYEANLMGQFDKNHSLHLIADERVGAFYFCFNKHGRTLMDIAMLNETFARYQFPFNDFFTANFIDKLCLVHGFFHKPKRLPHEPRLFQTSHTAKQPAPQPTSNAVVWTEENGKHELLNSGIVVKDKGVFFKKKESEQFIEYHHLSTYLNR